MLFQFRHGFTDFAFYADGNLEEGCPDSGDTFSAYEVEALNEVSVMDNASDSAGGRLWVAANP